MEPPNTLSVPPASEPDESENSEALEAFEANLRDTVNEEDESSSGISQINDTDIPEEGDDEIPQRFITGCVGNVKEARRRWELTKRWRHERNIDTLLEKPQEHFAFIKKHYPHYLHGQTKNGYHVYIERPGCADFTKLWTYGISLEDIASHYVFVTEYVWKHIDTREDGMLYTIFDLKGCKMGTLAGNVLKLFKKCSTVMQAHYPERSYRIMVINAPWWFNSAYAVIAPFIDPRTKKKLHVYGKHYLKHLLAEVDESSVATALGGSDSVALGDAETEKRLWSHVKAINAKHNVSFFQPDESEAKLTKSEIKQLAKARKAEEKAKTKEAKRSGKP